MTQKNYDLTFHYFRAFAIVSVLTVCITLPMVASYVNSVRSTMRGELDFCKVRLPLSI